MWFASVINTSSGPGMLASGVGPNPAGYRIHPDILSGAFKCFSAACDAVWSEEEEQEEEEAGWVRKNAKRRMAPRSADTKNNPCCNICRVDHQQQEHEAALKTDEQSAQSIFLTCAPFLRSHQLRRHRAAGWAASWRRWWKQAIVTRTRENIVRRGQSASWLAERHITASSRLCGGSRRSSCVWRRETLKPRVHEACLLCAL